MSHIEDLTAAFISILNDYPAQCISAIDNAGELTQYIDMADHSKPLPRLRRSDNGETFTYDNDYDIQLGCVRNSMGTINPSVSEFGGFYRTNAMAEQWELVVFVTSNSAIIDVNRLIYAFQQIPDCILQSIDTNPVSVTLRHALVYPKDLRSYDPSLRAFAFSYQINSFIDSY